MSSGKIFPYFLYLFIDYLIYLTLSSTDYKIYNRISPNYLITYTLMCSVAYIFLLITKKNPGLIDINSKGILERQISLTDPEVKLSYSPIMIMRLMPCNGCKQCKIYELPLRSYHCKKCQRCIRTFDHHCPIIGGCIGENNHFIFCLFLLTQSISFILGIKGILKKISLYRNTYGSTNQKIFLYSILSIIGIGVSFLIVYLLFHIFLILTNQTTFEVFCPQECPYLRIFKQERIRIYNERGIEIKENFSFRPFDNGIIQNIKYALYKLIHSTEKMKWEEIYFKNLKTNHIEFNLCDNKYLPVT